MASKKSRPLVDPPSASSSEDEVESEEEEEEEEQVEKEEESSDESPEIPQVKQKTANLKPSAVKPTKTIPPVEYSSESDSDKSPVFRFTPVVKPPPAKRPQENGKSPAKPKKLKTDAVGETNGATTGKSKTKVSTKEKSEKKTETDDDLTKEKSEKIVSDDLRELYPFLFCASDSGQMSNLSVPGFLKSNLSLIGSSNLKELNDKWKNYNAAEMELYFKRIDILRDEARMVLNAMKSSKD